MNEYMKKAFKQINPDKKEVEFEDARKIKRKRKKEKEKLIDNKKEETILSNKEGLEIVEKKYPDYIGFNQIKSKKGWRYKKKENVDEWTTFDFFEYTRKLYIKKYNKDWNLNRGGNSLEIKKIFDVLEKKFGSVSNLLLYDYIIFFFENHIDDFMLKYNNFYFSYLHKRKDVLKSFYNSYDYKKILRKNFKKSKMEISSAILDRTYLLSESALVCNYGIIISLNWLIIKKKFDEKQAIELIVDSCKKLYNKDMIDIVTKSTESYSPYTEKLIFKDIEKILNKIDKNLKMNIEFIKSEKNKLDFLVGGS